LASNAPQLPQLVEFFRVLQEHPQIHQERRRESPIAVFGTETREAINIWDARWEADRGNITLGLFFHSVSHDGNTQVGGFGYGVTA
jgi:hypothetical protein